MSSSETPSLSMVFPPDGSSKGCAEKRSREEESSNSSQEGAPKNPRLRPSKKRKDPPPPTTPPRTQLGNKIPLEHFSPGPPPGLTHLIPDGDQPDGDQIDRRAISERDEARDATIETIQERLKLEPLTTLYESEKGKIDDINEMIKLYSDPEISIPDTTTKTEKKNIHETTIASINDPKIKFMYKGPGCRLSNTYTFDTETNTGYKLFITDRSVVNYDYSAGKCRNTFINELVIQKYASLINHHTMNKLPVEPHNVTVRVPEITGYGEVDYGEVDYGEDDYIVDHRLRTKQVVVYYIKMEHFIDTEYEEVPEEHEWGESSFDSVRDPHVLAAIDHLEEKLRLLHNDVRMRNILKGNNEVVVIDFGESTVRRPSGVRTFPDGFGGKPRNRRVHKKTTRREGTRRKTKTTRREGTRRKTKTTRREGTRRKTKTQRRKRKSNKKK